MPEGHKTHYLAREHTAWFAGQSVRVLSPQGRFQSDARKVSGKVFDRCEAVGKHLFYCFDGGRIVHVHLGRYGKYRDLESPPPRPVGAVRMRLIGRQRTMDLTGPSTCRVIDSVERDRVVSLLGPDPLAGGKKSHVWRAVQVSSKPIGALILDQRVVAGVGNIFRAELFFEIGMDPNRRGCDLAKSEFDLLWKHLVKMMKVGLKYGKIVTVTAKEAKSRLVDLEGNDRFRVYSKDDCPSCGHAIEVLNLASRKLYWCPACQSV
ncbi:Fpg/Nei family DNA glycosylase [bacterium]|nr:Fpg/Nei family DNA glycosylase [bacterium]